MIAPVSEGVNERRRFVTYTKAHPHLYSGVSIRRGDPRSRVGRSQCRDKPVLLTPEGQQKLEVELEELRTVRRAEIAERIKYAKDFGDISENAEYEDAKNEQGMVEGRILTLENMLRNAVPIEESSERGVVRIGSEVELKDEFGKQVFTIVGPAEVDVASGRISMESPVGKALIGHRNGESVDVQSPGGPRRVKIVRVS